MGDVEYINYEESGKDFQEYGDMGLDEEDEINEEYEETQDILDESSDLPNTIEETEEMANELGIDNSLFEYLKGVEDKFQEWKIDDYTFMLEKLLIEYKRALIHKKFNITDEIDREKIERIRDLKKNLEKELINQEIDEFNFNKKYYNLLDLEYKLLLKYEDYSLTSKKLTSEVPKNIDEKLKEIIRSEHNYLKSVANDRNMYWPKKPNINKKDSNKVKFSKYLKYHVELSKASLKVKEFIPGYKFRTIEEVTKLDSDAKYTLVNPNSLKFEQLKQEFYKDKSEFDISLPMEKMEYELHKTTMKNILKDRTREQLLKCVTEADIINKQSYIERLRNNTVPVMKFREYPETYEKLKDILAEEAKYYKIRENNLMKTFNKNFYNISPDVNLEYLPSTFKPVYFVKTKDIYHKTSIPNSFSLEQNKLEKEIKSELEKEKGKEYVINPSNKGYSFLLKIDEIPLSKSQNKMTQYVEKGSTATISLKRKYFSSKKVIPNVINEKFYNIIKPLPDDLYTELKNKNLPSNKTELTTVYELHVPVPGLEVSGPGLEVSGPGLEVSNKKTVKLARRYENFEDYLSDLAELLEVNMMEFEKIGNIKSADVLYVKIQKIRKYLETGKDHEYEISNKYTLKQIVDNSEVIQKQRNIGINTLRKYIFEYYPENEEFVETLSG